MGHHVAANIARQSNECSSTVSARYRSLYVCMDVWYSCCSNAVSNARREDSFTDPCFG